MQHQWSPITLFSPQTSVTSSSPSCYKLKSGPTTLLELLSERPLRTPTCQSNRFFSVFSLHTSLLLSFSPSLSTLATNTDSNILGLGLAETGSLWLPKCRWCAASSETYSITRLLITHAFYLELWVTISHQVALTAPLHYPCLQFLSLIPFALPMANSSSMRPWL